MSKLLSKSTRLPISITRPETGQSRRADHEGSVRKRGHRWQSRVTLDGRSYAANGSTRTEAVHRMQATIARHEAGTLSPPVVSVAGWLSSWVADTGQAWKATTRERHADIVRLHLSPAIGDIDLLQLSPADIARCLARCGSVAPGTRLRIYRTLHRALNVAVFQGLLTHNPCTRVEAPRVVRRPPVLWSAADMRRFVESLTPSPYGRLWAILLGTGCRLGEALAARWRDYEAATGTLTIAATLSETRTQGTMRTAPKTAAGYRRVELPLFARRILDESGSEWGPADEAIVQTTTGKPPTRRLVGRAFDSACKRASVARMRVHDLRHLHASLLIGEGVPITVVSARLGHASPAITAAVYSHALPGSEGIAALAFDGVMNGRVGRLPAQPGDAD